MPDRSTLIPTARPADLASFTVTIDGDVLPGSTQVLSIVVRKGINRIPRAKIILADGDPAAGNFELSEDDRFRPGAEVEISAGYHGEEDPIFSGVIVGQRLKVKRNGSGCLYLELRDKVHVMTGVPKFKVFAEMIDSDVIGEILSEYGFESELMDTNGEHERMVQNGMTDWDFMVSRVRANAQLLTVSDGKVTTFTPDPSAPPVYTLTYGSTVLDAELELDSRIHLPSLKSRGWFPADQEISEVDAEYPDEPEAGVLMASDMMDLNDQSDFFINHAGPTGEGEMLAAADAQRMNRNFAKIHGTITAQGFPGVSPGDQVELQGFGQAYNNSCTVTSVMMELAQGNFTTAIEVGLSQGLLEPLLDHDNRDALKTTNGLHCGVVLQLEGDPNGEYRILVNLPMYHADGEGVWARVCTLDAGDGRGSFFMPEIGDEVIVGFLGQDPRFPIVLGMVHSAAKPSPEEPRDDNHVRGFVSRGEMKILFDDETNILEISTPNGNSITLDEDQGGIFIEDENGNTITMNSDGVSIDSPSDFVYKAGGDVTIEGNNVTISASGTLAAEGSASAELTSGGTCKVEGSLVTIN
jgi:Rhs element Vgr protein